MPIEWTSGDRLLVRGIARVRGDHVDAGSRRDWWVVSLDGAQHNLTANMSEPPGRIWAREDQELFVGTAGGEVWAVRPDSGAIENLTRKLQAPIKEIRWPKRALDNSQYARPGETYQRIYITAVEKCREETYELHLATGQISKLAPPDHAATLMAVSPNRETLYVRDDLEGLKLWSVNSSATQRLVDVNAHLRDVAKPIYRKVQYTSLDGEPLIGWLVLPADYRAGERYPLITYVYLGHVQRDVEPVHELHAFSDLFPVSRGYAVLRVSMPHAASGSPFDPMMTLPNGVLPAVDKAVELGVADPNRLCLLGASMGGYSVFGLLTQTNRFAAGAAMAGFSNLTSMYGRFAAHGRYTDFPHYDSGRSFMESIAMRAPPWKEAGRYFRNSPISYVDRVQTPLLIIHNDLDYVSIQQSEEFFFALHRQGKRVRFVRYWGEGHVLKSPANIEDAWGQILNWFGQNRKSHH